MKRKLGPFLFILIAIFPKCVRAQQTNLIGHQDLIGYYNPALTGGSYGQLSYLYRYQWEGLGPSASTLYFKYPLEKTNKFFVPHSIGSIFQYEDFNFLDRASLAFFASSTIAKLTNFRIGFGLNVGLSYMGFDTEDFNVEELVDPQLGALDRNFSVINKAGLSIHHKLFDLGFAARFLDAQSISDYHASYSLSIPLAESGFKLSPVVVLRMTESLESQVEGQLKTTFDEKVSLAVGHRQSFGAIVQFAFFFNKVGKVSYGIETPSNNPSSLGLTHELFGSYYFESPTMVQHRTDSIIKARRDSVNQARIEKYRRLRQEKIAREDSLSILQAPDEGPSVVSQIDSTRNDPGQTEKAQKLEQKGIYSSLEDLPSTITDDTHIVLNHIGFEPGLYLLTPESYKELDRLFHYIKHHKSLHIEIQGHTDDSGSPETNLSLSRYRALAVYNYLVSRGIDTAKMNVVGYGEHQPLYPNDTQENRELNRRIEIIFIKK